MDAAAAGSVQQARPLMEPKRRPELTLEGLHDSVSVELASNKCV